MGKYLKTMFGHTDWIYVIIPGKNGTMISGSADYRIKIWDIKLGECLKTLCGHNEAVCSLYLCEENGFLLSGSRDCRIRIWNLENWTCIKILGGHDHSIDALAVSHRGDIVSGSRDETM